MSFLRLSTLLTLLLSWSLVSPDPGEGAGLSMGGKTLLVILGAGTFSPWEERPATQIYFVAATQRGRNQC